MSNQEIDEWSECRRGIPPVEVSGIPDKAIDHYNLIRTAEDGEEQSLSVYANEGKYWLLEGRDEETHIEEYELNRQSIHRRLGERKAALLLNDFADEDLTDKI